ncbi:MAG TPA: hypothetical protein VGG59_10810 [Acidobacteriaceae bacterium]
MPGADGSDAPPPDLAAAAPGVPSIAPNPPVGPPLVGAINPQETTSNLPNQIVPPPPQDNLGALSRLRPLLATPPNQIPKDHWWNLTHPDQNVPESPNYNPAGRQGYLQSMAGVQQGVPGSAQPMTKLGKLMYILAGMGSGALVGSSQPTMGGGFVAAQQQQQEQSKFLQQQQLGHAQLQAARQNLSLIDTPFGKMPLQVARLMLPQYVKENIADKNIQSREKIADNRLQMQKDVLQSSRVEVTPEFGREWGIPQEYWGKQMKLTELASFNRSLGSTQTVVPSEYGAVLANKLTGKGTLITDSGGQPIRPVSWGQIEEAPDEANPGQTHYVLKGNLQGQPGMGSASYQVPLQVAKAEAPTKIGDQMVAFDAMIKHGRMLLTAARALQNDDQQTLNGIQNIFHNEFGGSGPVTAEAIADAYKGEVSYVLNKGHLTDTGNEKVAHTLDPTHQSPQQISDVVAAYLNLAQAKMDAVTGQAEAAITRATPQKRRPVPPKANRPPLTNFDHR